MQQCTFVCGGGGSSNTIIVRPLFCQREFVYYIILYSYLCITIFSIHICVLQYSVFIFVYYNVLYSYLCITIFCIHICVLQYSVFIFVYYNILYSYFPEPHSQTLQ